MKKLNKKGFTLVELLAVIVVLAFVMVLAAPSVLSSMNSARQSSFMLYAEKMLNSAQSRYQSDQLVQIMDDTYCYNISELSDTKTTQYSGFVIVTNGSKQTAEYRIQMFDKTYSIGMAGSARADGSITDEIADTNDGVTFNEIETIKTKLSGDKTLHGRDAYYTDGKDYLQSPCIALNARTVGDLYIAKDGTGSMTTNAAA